MEPEQRNLLTTGSIPRGILGLAVPMVVSGILSSIQHLVDLFWVKSLGHEAIAAVGMSGNALWVFVTAFAGIGTGTVAMVSRAVGAGDSDRANHCAGQSLALTAAVSVVIGVAGYVLSPYILVALGAEPSVVRLGTQYLHVTFCGVFFLLSAFVLGGIFQGSGDAMTPLMLGVFTTVCNAALTPVLVFGWLGMPALGVQGSAVGTVIAQGAAFAVGVWLLAGGRRKVRVRLPDLRPAFRTMWRLVTIGAPSSLQMCFRSFMAVVLVRIVASFGTSVVAAYAIGSQTRMIGMLPSFGFAGAAATMVGQNLGAGDPARAKRSAMTAMWMGLGVTTAAAVAFAVFARPVIMLFGSDESLVSTGTCFMQVTAAALATSSIGIILARAMNGAGDTVAPMLITLITLWGLQIPAAIWLSGIREIWGLTVPLADFFAPVSLGSETGIWWAMVAASVLQAVLTGAYFATGRWKHKKV